MGAQQDASTKFFVVFAILAATAAPVLAADENASARGPSLAVGPQYDKTHIYVAPEDFERSVESLIETFGGTKSQAAVIKITPTPSETKWQRCSRRLAPSPKPWSIH
jgi:hypothetical protein